METMDVFGLMVQIRGFTVRSIEGLDETEVLTIPEGFKNNILWNAGHIVWTQSRLIFGLSGLPLPIPDDFDRLFKDKSSPADWAAPPEIGRVMEVLRTFNDEVIASYEEGKFTTRHPFELRGMKIDTLDEAVAFHCFHEGLHLGVIASQKKLV